MATATRRLSLREQIRQSGPLKVDREKGIVYAPKVLGWESVNRRRYVREAVQRAVSRGLYDDVKVYADHPAAPGEQRPVRDLLAKLRGPYEIRADGLYAAEMHVLTTHELAGRVFEDCEKGLGLFGLSHNADAGNWEDRDGIQYITEISAVHSVDLVSDPATNANLWEGRTVARKTFRALVEGAPKLNAKFRKAILEMGDDYGMATHEMDEPPAGAEPDPKALLGQAVAALVQSADDADHELAAKVMKLLKPEPAGGGETITEEDDEEDDDEAPAKKESKRRRKPAPTVGITEAKAKALCTLGGIEATKEVLEAVVGVEESKALSVLALLKGRQQPAQAGGSLDLSPRSIPAGTVQERRQNGQAAPLKFDGTPEEAQRKRLSFLRN